MAKLKGLNLISICDHNSMLNVKSLIKLKHSVNYLFGCEVCSKEEVHLLVYFKEVENINNFQSYLEEHLVKIDNNPSYFGNQLISDEKDKVVDEYPYLLLMSINQSLEEIIKYVKKLNGKTVLAHALKSKNSITSQLAFIPENLEIDGVEVSNQKEKAFLINQYPFLKNKQFFINSDAHQLVDISEAVNEISQQEFEDFIT